MDDETQLFSFRQHVPIPSYLLAIAVGDIKGKNIGLNTNVFAEPKDLDTYAEGLSGLQTLFDAAQDYLIPYQWVNYDILVLPPSFPYGGMENPQLTFASPTIILKDKSQVYVATHEIVHSWFGNDVTCSNWENMWLNEGFTVFGERKISAKLNAANPNFAKVEAYLGNSAL